MSGTRRKRKLQIGTRKSYRKRGGGNHKKNIHSAAEEDSKYLVFYACFFGKDDNVANKIPNIPSNKYDCYYYTNNKSVLEKLKSTPWKGIYIDTPIKNNARLSAMDSKELKACPHHFKELNGYTYQCYFDTKLPDINEADILSLIRNHFNNHNVLMMVNQHRLMMKGDKNVSIWDEYDLAMLQDRYKVNSQTYKDYIEKEIHSGMKNRNNTHYETSFILRRAGDKINKINETWFEHIKKTGIECQISFFFIQQKFKDNIIPTPKRYKRSEDD
jgi:hypothetical protein